jgi:23S rRNA (uracil1939-C5)-methyltransferase
MTETVEITSVANSGHGVGRVDGRVCFVVGALPGDVVKVQVERETKGILWAVIEEVVEPSPHRTDAPCPVFGQCGGCAWLHFAYPAQGEWKQRIVRDCFERIARTEIETEWVEDPALRLGYRTRAEFHGDGTHWGFYARGTRDVVGIDGCPLCHEKLNAAFRRLRKLTYKGAVELVINPDGDDVLAWSQRPHRKLKATFEHFGTPSNKSRRAAFMFDGAPIVNGTFSQSSLPLNRLLRGVVAEMAASAESVLDLYCGNGNLSLGLTAANKIQGIDHNRPAVKAAAAQGKGHYGGGSTEAFAAALRSAHWNAVILDPPRTGAKELAKNLGEVSADAIIYVSCDPATLARDVKSLAAAGWRVDRTVVIDMFPNTAHVETVCRLVR